MSEINTGGPAFPVDESALIRNLQGMTLRDYFAAKAIEQVNWSNTGVTAGAETCFELADAMLKAREA